MTFCKLSKIQNSCLKYEIRHFHEISIYLIFWRLISQCQKYKFENLFLCFLLMISWLKSRLGHVFSSKNMYKNWKIPNDYYRVFDDGMYHANVFYWLISTRYVAAVHFQFVQKKGSYQRHELDLYRLIICRKFHFIYHFIVKLDRFFYTPASSCRNSVQILWKSVKRRCF